MSIPIVTLDQVRTEIKGLTQGGPDDSYVLNAIYQYSERIEDWMGYRFTPFIETRYFDAYGPHIDDYYNMLDLGYPLLEATTITDAQGNVMVFNTDYVFRPKGREPHYRQIRAMATSGWGWSRFAGAAYNAWIDSISVVGVWGYRRQYTTQGWIPSGDTVLNGAGIDAVTTSITVANAAGADSRLQSPRFSPGQMIKVDSEYMLVEAVPNATTLTVLRSVNGSTAATHALAATIANWQVQPEVVRAAKRWIAYIYERRGAFDQVKFDMTGSIHTFPTDMPGEVKGILDQLSDQTAWEAV